MLLIPPVEGVTGNSGQGMTGGTISGLVLADRVTGQRTQWGAVYDPARQLPLSKSTLQSLSKALQDTAEVQRTRE